MKSSDKLYHTTLVILTLILFMVCCEASEGYISNNSEDLGCLADNLYFEARGESEEGIRAVAKVTLNRVLDSRFPDTLCEVVWQKSQYSWTNDGKGDIPKNTELYSYMLSIANVEMFQYLYGEAKILDNSLYYHADYVIPTWDFNKLVFVKKIGVHKFYRDK